MIPLAVPANVRDILTEVTPHFEEYLRERFLTEEFRIRQSYALPNTFITDGSSNIYVSKLQMTKPIFNVSKFQVNLEMFNVCIEASLGQMTVEGNVDESTINAATPVSKSGRVSYVLEDVAFYGNIGIYIVEDSFMAKNYDINIKPSTTSIMVTWNTDNKVENFESSDLEKSLLKYILSSIVNVLQTDILHTQFGGAVVERSVCELLIDEPDEMIAISEERAFKCNNLIDSLLKIMNTFFEVSNETVLKTPQININISKENKDLGFVKSTNGELLNLATFMRLGDMNVYEKEGVQHLYGNIKLKRFKFNYVNCKAKYAETNSDEGTMKIDAYRNQIFIKLSLRQNGEAVNISVDKVQVIRIMDVDFKIDNMECLSSENDQIQSWVLGSLKGLVYPVLEEKIEDGLKYAILNRNV